MYWNEKRRLCCHLLYRILYAMSVYVGAPAVVTGGGVPEQEQSCNKGNSRAIDVQQDGSTDGREKKQTLQQKQSIAQKEK